MTTIIYILHCNHLWINELSICCPFLIIETPCCALYCWLNILNSFYFVLENGMWWWSTVYGRILSCLVSVFLAAFLKHQLWPDIIDLTPMTWNKALQYLISPGIITQSRFRHAKTNMPMKQNVKNGRIYWDNINTKYSSCLHPWLKSILLCLFLSISFQGTQHGHCIQSKRT